MQYWMGLDIGGTKIAAILVDELNQVKWENQVPTAKGDDLIPAVCELIDDALTAIDQADDELAGIGLGIPGKVVPETGEIHLAVNLDIDSPLAIGPYLSERYSTLVRIENDVRLGALGVQAFYQLDDVAYISIGTGLAAGFVLNGQIFRGKNGLAGEIGHLVESFSGKPMILEQTVSGPGLMQHALDAGCKVSSTTELFALADSGDATAEAVLQNMVHHLARAIQWIVLAFDIDHIVLGGGVTKAGASFETRLRVSIAQLREQSKVAKLLLEDDKLMILPGSHNPGMWGAVQLVRAFTVKQV